MIGESNVVQARRFTDFEALKSRNVRSGGVCLKLRMSRHGRTSCSSSFFPPFYIYSLNEVAMTPQDCIRMGDSERNDDPEKNWLLPLPLLLGILTVFQVVLDPDASEKVPKFERHSIGVAGRNGYTAESNDNNKHNDKGRSIEVKEGDSITEVEEEEGNKNVPFWKTKWNM